MISLVLEFVSAINAVDGRYMSTTEKNDLKSSMMRTFNTMSTTIWQADLMNNVTYAGISIDQWTLFIVLRQICVFDSVQNGHIKVSFTRIVYMT
jgi:hypothetical protein